MTHHQEAQRFDIGTFEQLESEGFNAFLARRADAMHEAEEIRKAIIGPDLRFSFDSEGMRA